MRFGKRQQRNTDALSSAMLCIDICSLTQGGITVPSPVATLKGHTVVTFASAAIVFPLPAGTIDCQVSVKNTGTVGLASFTLASTGNTVTGCTSSTAVLPGQNSTDTCTVHKPVNQTNFDAREASSSSSLSVVVNSITAASTTGVTVTDNSPVTFSGLQLAVNRSMTIATTLDKTEVSATGKCSSYLDLLTCLLGSLHWDAG